MMMVNGASIRLNSTQKGIRFAAEIGDTYDENAQYYMMIVPKNYLDHFGINDNYYDALLNALTAGGYSTYIASMQCLPYQPTAQEVADSNGVFQAGKWYVRGSLTTIQESNMNTEFFAIAYKVVDGKAYYANFNEGQNVRSVSSVAKAAIQSGVNYTDEQLTVLENFAKYAN
jgi:hypothetical protein